MHLNGIASLLLIATDKPVLHNTCFGKNVLFFLDCYTCMVFFPESLGVLMNLIYVMTFSVHVTCYFWLIIHWLIKLSYALFYHATTPFQLPQPSQKFCSHLTSECPCRQHNHQCLTCVHGDGLVVRKSESGSHSSFPLIIQSWHCWQYRLTQGRTK